MKNVFCAIFIMWTLNGIAQTEATNQYDQHGERHGVWKKYYKNGKQLRYEGEFNHGKEIGIFKFYKIGSKGKPAATKTYKPDSDSVLLRFYTKKGKLSSEGHVINESREGVWKYYKRSYKDSLMMVEEYKQGQLDGWKTVYFRNGNITDKTQYKAGKKEGDQIIYSENGNKLQEYHFKNDKLHGYSKVYDKDGNVLSEGLYKQGLRDGEWRYYTNGKLDSIQHFPLKKPKNRRNK